MPRELPPFVRRFGQRLAFVVLSLAAALPAQADESAVASQTEREQASWAASPSVVGQRLNAPATASGKSEGRLSYRGDLSGQWAAGAWLGAEWSLAGHMRFGRGAGVVQTDRLYTGAVNSLAFPTGDGYPAWFAILAEAYANLSWPVAVAGAGSQIDVTVGKLDPFVFFDQNAVAADESRQFLNNVFVHNPLLDSGKDVAVDDCGFAPGLRLAYRSAIDRVWSWSGSVGVFASGNAARLHGDVKAPLGMAQLELTEAENGADRAVGGYRLYVWTNGQTMDALAQRPQRHAGVGVSVDRRVSPSWVLFGRWGKRTAGTGVFDQGTTVGGELDGRYWSREQDVLGLALGFLNGSGSMGQEQLAEMYYRLHPHEGVEISPDIQLIRNPGGQKNGGLVKAVGLRVTLSY